VVITSRFAIRVLAIIALLGGIPARAAEPQHCVRAAIVLWGDARHDDSAALNAWLRGEPAIWADSGEPVGASIAGHNFHLSAAVYVIGGTGRRLENFRMVWPERGETVAGGTIMSGSEVEAAPVITGVSIQGGDPGEGIPFEAPAADPADRQNEASCATS
jgi:hypothetical protein